MRLIQRAILEEAIRWCSNILIEAMSNAQLGDDPKYAEPRQHIKDAIELLARAGIKMRMK
jgi:hypothetical protein